MNELIGGEKGEGQQMAVWEKIFDQLSGLVAEADEIELDNDIVKRGREIVTFVKGKKYAPPHSTHTQRTRDTHNIVDTRGGVAVGSPYACLCHRECLKMFEEATKESNKEVLITAIKKGRDLGLSTLLSSLTAALLQLSLPPSNVTLTRSTKIEM